MMTIKQKNVIKNLAEITRKGGTKGELLKKAGYGEDAQKHPGRILKSKALRDYLDAFDKKATAKTLESLTKKKTLREFEFPPTIDDKDIKEIFKKLGIKGIKIIDLKTKKIVYYVDDSPIVMLKAIELVAKMRGDMAPIAVDLGKPYIQNMSQEQLIELLAQKIKEVKNGKKR